MIIRKCALLNAIWIVATLAIPVSLAAQGNQSRDDSQKHHRRDAKITILQTTDLHHHANGVDHVGLDVDPVNGTSMTGAYSRISAYVNYVRESAHHPVVL